MQNGNEHERIRELEASLASCQQERTTAQRAEALLQIFHDSAKDYAFVTLDTENRIIDWSRGAERILGYSKQEVIGRSGSIFFTCEDVCNGEVDRELLLARTQDRAEDECWHQRKDGSRFWGSGVMAPLCDTAGRQIGYGKVLRDLTARKEMEERLTASLREKDVLLREIHHRVKNNLQVITSLISLQARASTQPDMQEIFEQLHGRVRAIAALHESLCSSADLGSILFGSYMEQLIRELLVFHGIDPHRVSVDVKAADVVVTIEQALPLGLIVNELITNCFKHAFPEKQGTINVLLEYVAGKRGEEPQHCELSVSDNGTGMGNLDDARHKPSMGLHIIELLVSELRGALDIGQDQHRGTKFTLRFPLLDAERDTDSQDNGFMLKPGHASGIEGAASPV